MKETSGEFSMTVVVIIGAIIVVTFDGIDKKFQFPGGFENGFLFLTEDE